MARVRLALVEIFKEGLFDSWSFKCNGCSLFLSALGDHKTAMWLADQHMTLYHQLNPKGLS